MIVLICGDRNWTNEDLIREKILEYNPKVILEGDARGADKIAGKLAKELGIDLIVFPAKWSIYGKSAGPMRNREMLSIGLPELVLAFHNDIVSSKGTKDMIKAGLKLGVRVRLFTEKREEDLLALGLY